MGIDRFVAPILVNQRLTANTFCPTGQGSRVDPTCGRNRGLSDVKWKRDWRYGDVPLTEVPLSKLYTRDQDTWSESYRDGIGAERVKSLASKMAEEEMTAVPVRPHKDGYVLIDGTHRTYAAESRGATRVMVQVVSNEPYVSSAPSARFGVLRDDLTDNRSYFFNCPRDP